MGKSVLDELRLRHIPTRAVVRRPQAIDDRDGLTLVQGDVFNEASLTNALQGSTTLISAFNPGWQEPSLYERYLEGSWAIVRAAERASVKRVLIVGGAASLLDSNGEELLSHGVPPEPFGSGVRAARDFLHQLRDASDVTVDWAFISPPPNCGPMGPTGRTGSYRRGTDHPVVDADGVSSLSVEDLAVAIVDEALSAQAHRTRFTVGY